MVNTFDVATLLPNLRIYLAGLGIVRAPTTKGSLLPPLWLDRAKGVPFPGQTEDLGPGETHPNMVLGAYPTTGIPSRPFEGFYRQKGVTIYIRGRQSPMVQALYENQLLPALHDVRNIDMNGLLVNQSMNSRDLSRIGADSNGYVFSCEFMLDLFSPIKP
jgi:hypothetical protein